MSSIKRSILYGLTIVIVFVVASISVPQEEIQASVTPHEDVQAFAVLQEDELASSAMTLMSCHCEYACEGDLDRNGVVNQADADLLTRTYWGCRCEFHLEGDSCFDDPCGNDLIGGDLNDDGVVNIDDLIILLANWGTCP